MAKPYSINGKGTLWPAVKGDRNWDPELVESLIEFTGYDTEEKEVVRDTPWLGGYNQGDFQTEEVYVHESNGTKYLNVDGSIGEVFVGIDIPIKNTEEMQQIVEDMSQVVTIDKQSSGLYLKPGDFSEILTKRADAQGRINLGKDRAGKDVKVVILDE